jgi:hypothetical protein
VAGGDETGSADGAGGAEVCRPASAPSKSKPKSKSKSGSSGGSAGSADVDFPDVVVPDVVVPGTAVPAAGAVPKRSRNGESMSIGSTGGAPLVRGRIGCGAWKTATAPWPGPGDCSTVSSGE